MSLIEAIILGLIQGLTEFLPVSSSGHLVLAQKFMNLASDDLMISVVAHFGTVLAIIFFYRKEFTNILLGLFDKKVSLLVNPSLRLIALVFVAILPAGFAGLLLKDFLQSLFGSSQWVGIFMFVTALVLLLSLYKTRKIEYSESFVKTLSHQITFTQALLIGCAQALAICPGLSRSGTTITAGLFLGLKRRQAAFFSFLISVPVILGALVLELKGFNGASIEGLQALALIFISSLIFGLVGLFGVVSVLNRGKLYWFAFYLIPLATYILFFMPQ